MKIINNKFIPFRGYSAMAIFPFIFVRGNRKLNNRTLRHELIHFNQQKELFIIGFYVLYLLFYIVGLIRYFNTNKAYHSIPFEKEAYDNQNNIKYLETRQKFNWLRS